MNASEAPESLAVGGGTLSLRPGVGHQVVETEAGCLVYLSLVDDEIEERARALYGAYQRSASVDIALLLQHYAVADVARRVVGVGSVGTRCYLAALHSAEAGSAHHLKRLLTTPKVQISVDIEKAIPWVEKQQGIQLSAEQADSLRMAVQSPVLVITGGPGTEIGRAHV